MLYWGSLEQVRVRCRRSFRSMLVGGGDDARRSAGGRGVERRRRGEEGLLVGLRIDFSYLENTECKSERRMDEVEKTATAGME